MYVFLTIDIFICRPDKLYMSEYIGFCLYLVFLNFFPFFNYFFDGFILVLFIYFIVCFFVWISFLNMFSIDFMCLFGKYLGFVHFYCCIRTF